MNREIRKLIVDAAYHAKHGHMPSALSIVDIICALDEIMCEEDQFVLSKGHGCLAYYAYLVVKGDISLNDIRSFGKKGSKLGGHPDKNKIEKVYASTGSLGQGLPITIGAALARKIQHRTGRFFCLVGDGECNEGSVWESCMIAAKHNLSNIVCIVDVNNSQTRSLQLHDLANKFKAFDWHVIEIDGHDTNILKSTLSLSFNKPLAVIANTVKGKGILELENNMFAWHHRAPNKQEYEQFLLELDEK